MNQNKILLTIITILVATTLLFGGFFLKTQFDNYLEGIRAEARLIKEAEIKEITKDIESRVRGEVIVTIFNEINRTGEVVLTLEDLKLTLGFISITSTPEK